MARRVTLVLCTRAGELLGELAPFTVDDPHLPEAGPVVAAARGRFGVDIAVLRLLDVTGAEQVTYLAQVDEAPSIDLTPWAGADPLADHPARAAYARPGGPDEELAWADAALAGIGRTRTGSAEQMRTWNLSAVWRLPTAAGPTWLKVLPRFLAREPAMLAVAGADVGPPVLASEPGRVLMDHVVGTDQYGASGSRLLEFARALVDLQAGWIDRGGELLDRGAVDWRPGALTARIEAVVATHWAALADAERRVVDHLVAGLPGRLAALAECGIPDTLVHGDFHRGNVRGEPGHWVILDWGEVGVGPPLFDQVVFTRDMAAADGAAVDAEWARLWRARRPGCDPERALRLTRPLADLMSAAIYQGFLDAIEPDEQVYHRDDPLDALRRAAWEAGV